MDVGARPIKALRCSLNDTTLLHRQINPSWVQQGRVTSQAFRPTPKDESKLSVYDGDQIEPEKAWQHFTSTLKLASTGVLSITVSECSVQDLPVSLDPIPYPEHTIIDYSAFTPNQREKKAKILRNLAEARGWQYRDT
jgi:hypothetical protein